MPEEALSSAVTNFTEFGPRLDEIKNILRAERSLGFVNTYKCRQIGWCHCIQTFECIGLKSRIATLLDSVGESSEPLQNLGQRMATFLVSSRSDGTVTKYFSAFKRWETFVSKMGISAAIPAEPIHVALYLTDLLDHNSTYSVLQTAVYSIKWAHTISGFNDPTCNNFVTNLLEASKRQPHRPVVNKDHITPEVLIELCTKYKHSTDLPVVRDLIMILLSYAGFLRFDELSSILCKDICFSAEYFRIFIRKSKTDQYRQGNSVLISKGCTSACPLSMLRRYCDIANINNDSDDFLFKPMFKSKGVCKLIYKIKPLSYTRAKECIVGRLKEVCGSLNIGLHSLRAGGASAAANSNVNDRCWKRHGRWVSDSAKDGYVADSLANRLKVTQNIGI